tara:strand:+ start:1513 stop:1701 length:189 start_codon:yes stop_codon:yes gene_type:complete
LVVEEQENRNQKLKAKFFGGKNTLFLWKYIHKIVICAYYKFSLFIISLKWILEKKDRCLSKN